MWHGCELSVILILRDTEQLLHAAKNDFPDGQPAVGARAIPTVSIFLIFLLIEYAEKWRRIFHPRQALWARLDQEKTESISWMFSAGMRCGILHILPGLPRKILFPV